MANLLGAKFVDTGLRTYFLFPFEAGAFHIEKDCYFRLIEITLLN